MTEGQWLKVLLTLGALLTAWGVIMKVILPNIRSYIFTVIRDEREGLPILREAVMEAFKDRVGKTDRYIKITDDHEGRLDAAEMAIKSHSIQITEVKAHADGVPALTGILTRIQESNELFAEKFETAMDKFTSELTKVRESVARMEGKWDGVNRRDH